MTTATAPTSQQDRFSAHGAGEVSQPLAAARHEPTPRHDLLACCAITLLWLLAAAVIGVRADFPLNDDWAYAKAVEALVHDGEFTRVEWTWVSLVTHTLIGAAFSSIFGFSFDVLRLSTLTMGWLGLLGTYALARQAGGRPVTAAFVAAVLALNPFYLSLSYTFMTEVPFTALVTWALVFWTRGLRTGRAAWLVAGALVVTAATLSRQLAIPIAAGMGFAAVLPRWRQPSRWLIGIAVPVVALAAYLVVPPLLYGNVRRGTIHSDIWYVTKTVGGEHIFFLIVRNSAYAIATIGAILLPFVPLIARTKLGRRPAILSAAVACALPPLGVAALKGWRLPAKNILHERGIGPIALKGVPDAGRLLDAAWWALTVVCTVVAAYVLVVSVTQIWRERVRLRRHEVLLCTIVCAALYLCAVAPWRFDRYLLPVIPSAFAVVLIAASADDSAPPLRPRPAALAILFLVGAFSVIGTRDYLLFNRTRWDMLAALTSDGVSADRIDGGFEFNAWHNYTSYRDPLYKSPKGAWVRDNEYVLTLADSLPGYTVVRRRTVPGLLNGPQINLFRREPESPAARDASSASSAPSR
jgi:4-amino-4-deoxy-L-arabinose transferase-like glycosyltransferase